MSTSPKFLVLKFCPSQVCPIHKFIYIYIYIYILCYIPGNKDQEVKMVRNGTIVEAHQWSMATQQWTKLGEVVDAVGSSRKQLFQGREYDYVFDVDIADGAPPLKLPFNVNGIYTIYI